LTDFPYPSLFRSEVALFGAHGALAPLAVALVFGGELISRYLFYVTVVPLDMPGSFSRSMR
jgi:hypothetical protein